ncbi:hypothetical protein AWJ20_849 [Sugiyamaella lignohabitans]|uniref:MAGE domain-containing protein n=1 Tax=Sugiyamaella lignohabitans TaxID=796027 RepID=A0A167D807_9ASCO|nr:uncharacterized protein AWJ20_849 [Sugiyamaella lignohabitans]ANB12592.1 hypothetical protein AWJ20_849 [Sugiyamaella lignohabitans]
MPKSKRREDDSNDDRDRDYNHTTTVSPSPEPMKPSDTDSGIDAAELDRMANQLVRMALFGELTRTTIKKANIYKTIISDSIAANMKLKTYRNVFVMAQKKLRSIFGMELIPLPPKEFPEDLSINTTHLATTRSNRSKRPKRQKTESGEGQDEDDVGDVYMLRNTLPLEYRQVVAENRSVDEQEFYGQAFIICSIILLHPKGYMERSDLSRYLIPLGIDLPMFDTLISKLTSHSYVVQQSNNDPGRAIQKRRQYYSLGPRAKVEFGDNQGFKEICSKILGETFNPKISTQIDSRLKAVKMLHSPVASNQISDVGVGIDNLEDVEVGSGDD